MSKRRDYYRILHVQPDAPEEIIRASYRTLMQRMRMHPDLGGTHENATLINEAFRTLGNPYLRARYDQLVRDTAETVCEGESGTPDATEPVTSSEPDKTPFVPQSPRCPYCRERCSFDARTMPDAVCAACDAPLCAVQHHEPDADARRAVDRLPRNMRMTFRRAGGGGAVHKGMTRDLSLNGMRFLTETVVIIGDTVMVTCELGSAVGVVRSVTPCADDRNVCECGVEFVTLQLKRERGGLLSSTA